MLHLNRHRQLYEIVLFRNGSRSIELARSALLIGQIGLNSNNNALVIAQVVGMSSMIWCDAKMDPGY